MMTLFFVSGIFKRSVLGVIRFTSSSVSLRALKTNPVRCLCSTMNNQSQDAVPSPKKATWKPIYFFPLIHIARLLNRLKIYQTVFTFTSVPLLTGLYYHDLSDINTVFVVTGAATFTCLSLYIITAFFKRLIGVIYIDEAKKDLRIAHLTFWGNRKDITVPINDIIPLIESNCNARDAFVKLHRYSTEEILYLTIRFGKILEKDDFQDVFGSLELLGLKK